MRNSYTILLVTQFLSLHLIAQQQFDAAFVRYSGLRHTCDGVFTPVVTIKNVGSTAMNSCVVDTWKNGVQVNSFNWILAVAALPDESRKPALPPVTDVQPGDVLEFQIISVNEQPDQGAADNVLEVEVEAAPPVATSYLVRVALPAAGAMGTTWRVINALGQPAAQGGPYSSASDEEVWVTLEADGCYALELSGEMACEGRLFSDGQEILSVTCGGAPGTYSAGFLTGTVLGVHDVAAISDLAMYPNPTTGSLSIVPTLAFGPAARILILDASGRELQARTIVPQQASPLVLDLSILPNGAYLVRAEATSGAVHQGRVVLAR